MNISTKLQLHPLKASEMIFDYFAMATNQIQQFGQNSYGW